MNLAAKLKHVVVVRVTADSYGWALQLCRLGKHRDMGRGFGDKLRWQLEFT